MNLIPMKYKNYIWPHNPSELKISSIKNLKEFIRPFYGSVFQDFGREKRIITGRGEFYGENCLEQFDELFSIFKSNDSGLLCIPNMSPFVAEFKSFEMDVQNKPNIIGYSFEFWEDMSDIFKDDYRLNETHKVEEGETLWDIAYIYNISINDLLKINKNIKNPNDLSTIKVVTLK